MEQIEDLSIPSHVLAGLESLDLELCYTREAVLAIAAAAPYLSECTPCFERDPSDA